MAVVGPFPYFSETVRAKNRRTRALDFYSSIIPSGTTVFDVGANLGNYTRYFVDVGANVVAFEPIESCAKAIEERFREEEHVVLVNEGAGAEIGETEIFFSEDATEVASMSTEWIDEAKRKPLFADQKYNWKTSKLVPITTLDAQIEKHEEPSFAKNSSTCSSCPVFRFCGIALQCPRTGKKHDAGVTTFPDTLDYPFLNRKGRILRGAEIRRPRRLYQAHLKMPDEAFLIACLACETLALPNRAAKNKYTRGPGK